MKLLSDLIQVDLNEWEETLACVLFINQIPLRERMFERESYQRIGKALDALSALPRAWVEELCKTSLRWSDRASS